MSLKMKLNIVNKKEYEENEDYREIVIVIPKEKEELEKDFKYLGLDYKNVDVKQDIYVLNCEVIDTENSNFSTLLTTELSNIIDKGKAMNYITSYQDAHDLLYELKFLSDEHKESLLAILEAKKEKIYAVRDVVKCTELLDLFDVYDNINNNEEYALKLIEHHRVKLKDIVDYIDLNAMGGSYINKKNGAFTARGLVLSCYNFENYLEKRKSQEETDTRESEEEEEEFE